MKSILAIAALIVLAILALAANTAAEAYQYHAENPRPASVTDIVMQSRQTPSAPSPERSNGMLLGAGLLALVMLFIGAMLFIMFGGTKFLKELRLSRKKRPYPHRNPYAQTGNPPDQFVRIGQPVRRVQEIPAWTETESDDEAQSDYRR